MTWQVTGSAPVSGTVTLVDTQSGATAQGALTGELSGSTLEFAIQIPLGGFSNPYRDCRADVSGRAQVSSDSISGTYSGTNTCTGLVNNGQLTLARQ